MRHAWLIIAHNEFGILQRLVSALDAPECDIYIHIDKKFRQLPEIYSKASAIYILDRRVDVRWGSVSQIRCEFVLLEAAVSRGTYDYYHIISGTTLPLKPLDEIMGFFESHLGNSVFSGIGKDQPYQETLKIHRYNLFLRNYTSRNRLLKWSSQFLWKSAIAAQRALGIESNKGKEFFKSSNWLSLTEDAVQYLLSRKEAILRSYRYSFCGDEYFIPSELMASPLQDRLVSDDRYLLHNITRSNAGVFHLYELERLRDTDYLFARKFTER